MLLPSVFRLKNHAWKRISISPKVIINEYQGPHRTTCLASKLAFFLCQILMLSWQEAKKIASVQAGQNIYDTSHGLPFIMFPHPTSRKNILSSLPSVGFLLPTDKVKERGKKKKLLISSINNFKILESFSFYTRTEQ